MAFNTLVTYLPDFVVTGLRRYTVRPWVGKCSEAVGLKSRKQMEMCTGESFPRAEEVQAGRLEKDGRERVQADT